MQSYTFKGIMFDVPEGNEIDDSKDEIFIIYTSAYPKVKDNITITFADAATPDDYTEEKLEVLLRDSEPGFQNLISRENNIWRGQEALNVYYTVSDGAVEEDKYLMVFFGEDLTYFFFFTEKSWDSGDEFIITLESISPAN